MLQLSNLGPIASLGFVAQKTNILTGAQASGKSTLAKALFFDNKLLEILYAHLAKSPTPDAKLNSIAHLEKQFIEAFKRIFGSVSILGEIQKFDAHHKLIYTLKQINENTELNFSTYFYSEFDLICNSIHQINQEIDSNTTNFLVIDELTRKKSSLATSGLFRLFDAPYNHNLLYLPAARGYTHILQDIKGYVDDLEKSYILDLISKDYLRMVDYWKKKLASQVLGNGLGQDAHPDKILVNQLIKHIIQAHYYFQDNEDRLGLPNGQYVKLQFASSGQQEAVWPLIVLAGIIYEQLDNPASAPTFLIIEEPEAHLFPSGQYYFAQLLALYVNINPGNKLFITTHSPYFLYGINNLLYGGSLKQRGIAINDAMPDRVSLNVEETHVLFMQANSQPVNMIDAEAGMISVELIEAIINDEVNKTYDKLAALDPDMQ